MIYHIADVKNYNKPVWFSKKAIANIFLLKIMKRQYRVTYDSLAKSFLVHQKGSGLQDIIFQEHTNGLHFFDPQQADCAFVEMVESNMKLFLKWQVALAEKARSLYASLGFPSKKDFLWILKSNQIKDCPVMAADAMVAYKIWGRSIAALKGKTVQTKPEPVNTDTVHIPKESRSFTAR